MQQLKLFVDKEASEVVWKLFVDGAARNNPGPAGIGIYIEKNGTSFKKEGFFIGIKTNNQAEYAALLIGLHLLKEVLQFDDVLMIFSDSNLMVQQILGNYRVKQPELQKLFAQVIPLLEQIRYTIHHVPRENNSIADALANQGIDKKNKLPHTLEEIVTL